MASSSCLANLLLFIFALFITSPTSINCTSSSFSASEQLKFWSENVDNKMPIALLSKLFPMTKNDTDYFTSLVTHHVNIPSNAHFCDVASLACSSRLSKLVPTKSNFYNIPDISKQTKVIPLRSNLYNTPDSSQRTKVMPLKSNLYNTPDLSQPTKAMPSRSNLYNTPISSQPTKFMPSRSNLYNTPDSSQTTKVMPSRSNL